MRPFRSIFRKGNFLIIFLLIASSAYCYGQFDQRYTVTHYTDENGLSQNSVNGIAEDKEGFIWLTTESGLVRFDGQNFHTFDKSNSNLTTIRFNAIYPDLSGTGHKIFASNDSFEFMSIQGPNVVRDTVASIALFNRIGYEKQDFYPYLQSVVISTSSQKAFIKDLEMTFPLRYIMLAPSHAGTYYFVDHERITFFRQWKKVYAFSYKRPKLQDLFTLGDKLYCFGDDGKVRLIDPDKEESVRLTGDILTDADYDPNKRNFIGYWNNISDQCFILLKKKLYFLNAQSDGALDTKLVLDGFDFTSHSIENVHYNPKQKRLFLGSATHGLFIFNPKNFRALVVSRKNQENLLKHLTNVI